MLHDRPADVSYRVRLLPGRNFGTRFERWDFSKVGNELFLRKLRSKTLPPLLYSSLKNIKKKAKEIKVGSVEKSKRHRAGNMTEAGGGRMRTKGSHRFLSSDRIDFDLSKTCQLYHRSR